MAEMVGGSSWKPSYDTGGLRNAYQPMKAMEASLISECKALERTYKTGQSRQASFFPRVAGGNP